MLKVGDLMYYVSKSNTFSVIESELICIIPKGPVPTTPDYFEYTLDLQGYNYKVEVISKEIAVQEIEATGCVFATKEKAIKYRMQLLQDRLACLQGALEEAQADLDNIIGVTYA